MLLCTSHMKCTDIHCVHIIPHENQTGCGRIACMGHLPKIRNICKETNLKETRMEETITLKVKNVKKAHEKGCSDVKKTIELMCPELFKTLTPEFVEKVEILKEEAQVLVGGLKAKEQHYFAHEMLGVLTACESEYENIGRRLKEM